MSASSESDCLDELDKLSRRIAYSSFKAGDGLNCGGLTSLLVASDVTEEIDGELRVMGQVEAASDGEEVPDLALGAVGE